MIGTENSASARLPMVRRIGAWFVRRLDAFAHAQARRAARRELYALDDRLLNDIGLRREQIAEFVDGMFRKNDAPLARPVTASEPIEVVVVADAGNDRRFKSAA